MKKTIFSLILLIALGFQCVNAQEENAVNDVKALLNELKTNETLKSLFELTELTKDMMDEMGMSEDEAKYFDAMDIFVMNEDVEKTAKAGFVERIVALTGDENYAPLVNVNSEGNIVSVYAHQEEEIIKDLTVLVVSDDGEVVIINIIGNIPADKWEEMINI